VPQGVAASSACRRSCGQWESGRVVSAALQAHLRKRRGTRTGANLGLAYWSRPGYEGDPPVPAGAGLLPAVAKIRPKTRTPLRAAPRRRRRHELRKPWPTGPGPEGDPYSERALSPVRRTRRTRPLRRTRARPPTSPTAASPASRSHRYAYVHELRGDVPGPQGSWQPALPATSPGTSHTWPATLGQLAGTGDSRRPGRLRPRPRRRRNYLRPEAAPAPKAALGDRAEAIKGMELVVPAIRCPTLVDSASVREQGRGGRQGQGDDSTRSSTPDPSPAPTASTPTWTPARRRRPRRVSRP